MQRPSVGKVFVLACLLAIALAAFSAVIHAAGRQVAIAVAVAALVGLVGSYVRLTVLIVRVAQLRARAAAAGDDAAEYIRRPSRVHFAMVVVAPLLVLSSRPWGNATFVVAGGTMLGCQILFVHALVVAGVVFRRRRQSNARRP